MQRALDLEEKKIKVFEEREKNCTEDADLIFLRSLHPFLQKARDKLELCMQITSVIKDFLRSEELLDL
jgi:hypothetical protein